MKIDTILDQIDLGAMALPEFQRGFVWNRDQVRGLMDSLYRKHPIGGLLVWVTKTDHAPTRGKLKGSSGGPVELLLDGQQRITSLYGMIKGRPPKFFDGNEQVFTGLYFNLADETFEFYAPLKMKDNPLWVSVTELMQRPVGDFIPRIMAHPELAADLTRYITRLTSVQWIKDIELHIERVTGEDKTVDVVVDIFNRVNSGGTKLSKGDLALAKICAAWPEAREEMKRRLEKWKGAGYGFRLDWLLRCITATTTGEAFFSSLVKVDTAEFRDGLDRAEHHVDHLLNIIAGRLGLDHADVLGSSASLPLLCRYLDQRGGKLPDPTERDRLLYWYIQTFLWGRYAGSTESVLSQDLRLIQEPSGALDRLIEQLRQNRGDLRIQPNDFLGWSRGARFYPLLYMLTRVHGAKDLGSGLELHKQLLGYLMRLELHHIFPKAKLYKHGYSRPEVNALANFMFQTQETNLEISDRDPKEYLAHYEERRPGVLASQWIPTDPTLWDYEQYPAFLAERRRLLAKAANDFLDSLVSGSIPEVELAVKEIRTEPEPIIPSALSEDEEEQLIACNEWVIAQGLPAGDFYFELLDPATEQPIALLDVAWPDGLQPGYSQPVALLLNEESETEEAANQAGFRFFTNLDAFRRYVETEILARHLHIEAAD